MPSLNVGSRDAAWLYAKGYDIDAAVETIVHFIGIWNHLELTAGAPK
jgi:hypothetical protein